MEIKYEELENKILKLEKIEDTENIINDIKMQDIEINDIDGIMGESHLKVGSLFSSTEDRLYLNQDLYGKLPEYVSEIPVAHYRTVEELKDLQPINILEHFDEHRPMKEVSDIDIINMVYGEQTRNTYEKVRNIIEISEKRAINIPYDLLLQLTMVNSQQEVDDYRKLLELYFEEYMDLTLISLKTKDGHEYTHIKIEINEKGEVIYKVNRNPGEVSEEWDEYTVPFHTLGDLMTLTLNKVLILEVQDKDLIFSKKVGKLSGMMENSKIDREIFDYLNINNLYRKGTFSSKSKYKPNVTPRGSVETLSWI